MLNPHPVRSALSLVITLVLLAVMFVFLEAHLVAALQIVVYAGAVMVLFLFVIMLLNLQRDPADIAWRGRGIVAMVVSVLFGVVCVVALRGIPAEKDPVTEGFGSTAVLSARLFTHFVLPFEITGILLLVAVVGAVVLAKKKID